MLAMTTAIVLSGAASAFEPGAEPLTDVAPGLATAFEALPDVLLDASETRCDSLNTICATSIALSSVVCTRPLALTVQCTGASTFGGHGVSPLKLPGSVSWSGRGSCSNECSSPFSQAGSGGASWPGGLGPNGSGTQETKNFGTKVKFSVFRTCITYTVSTNADASAKTTVLLSLTSVSAPRASHTQTNSLCNY